MRYWLLKTEPGCYSIDDLKKDTKTSWGGIRNYQARNMLRDQMKKGDLCLFYHSSVDPAAAVGICEVIQEGYPDPTQFDPKDDHYDADSDPRDPRWFCIDVSYKGTFAKPVSIGGMRLNKKLAQMKLLEKGSRLSVLPVEQAEFEEVVRMAA
jgi:predicted RNA-binding protein with PUA-like domain